MPAPLLRNPRQTPFITGSQDSDCQRSDHAHGGGKRCISDHQIENIVKKAADNGSYCVDVLSQNAWGFLTHHISENTAADSGGGPEKDAEESVVSVSGIDGGLRSGHHKGGQADCVENIIDGIQADLACRINIMPFPGNYKNQERADSGNQQELKTVEHIRREFPQQNITDGASAESGYSAKEKNAEQIHSLSDSHHGTGDSEGNRADNFSNMKNDNYPIHVFTSFDGINITDSRDYNTTGKQKNQSPFTEKRKNRAGSYCSQSALNPEEQSGKTSDKTLTKQSGKKRKFAMDRTGSV